ncbi:MAG: VCBS repeat-containing protein, partial [Bacteroidales bacterium]|nr:VCBS repeat-containing protein [Bacteroidales bacterium]
FRKELAIYYDLGMVTDAVWSDYNGDGWEDLIVAREWNSIMLLENRNGKKILEQEFTELENKHGMWFSINQGDFDQDGDPDYILGNLGDNHRFNVSEQHPMKVYALDLDMNGSLDPISTGYWKDQHGYMTEYPINYMDELVGQSNFFLRKFKGYTPFSYASIDQILDSATMNRVDHRFYTHTSSSFILWNDEGGFRWEKLPPAAQVAPIKKSIIQDFNEDGYPDLLLAGNDHTYDIGTGYYDANKGLLLLSSEGKPLSRLLPSSESGIILHGMVESLLYMDGEFPHIVAGMNRDSVIVYTVNR